jgi:hypothetical protein
MINIIFKFNGLLARFYGILIAAYSMIAMLKLVKKFLMPLLVILISIMLGYVLRMYHEGKIRRHYQSQAEKELGALEEEFHSAWKKPHVFFIFNGRFEIYPMKEPERTFSYRELWDGNSGHRDTKLSRNAESKTQE